MNIDENQVNMNMKSK